MAERADRFSELSARLLDAAREGLFVVDADGILRAPNQAARELFGLTEPLPELPASRFLPLLAQASARSLVGDVIDTTALPSSGEPLAVVLAIHAGPDGSVLVAIEAADLPARRAQLYPAPTGPGESQLLEGLAQLAGGVAHDFNNLLGVVLNYTSLLSRSLTDDVQRSDVAEIRKAAERGAALTRELLGFARRDLTEMTATDLTDLVRAFAAERAGELDRSINVVLDMPARPVLAEFDVSQMTRVLRILADNARDAMPDGGTITIRVRAIDGDERRARLAVVSVEDTGVGMDALTQSRAFEPFFTTKTKESGFGLGLSTLYGLVHQNGGEVLLQSAPGSGTTVTVQLPSLPADGEIAIDPADLAANTASVAVPDGDSAEPPDSPGEGILLVEDEDSLRNGMARLLASHGYRVAVAADGVDALDMFRRNHDDIDVVVTDISMPRMRGDELLVELQRIEPALKFVVMTGYAAGVQNALGPVGKLTAHARLPHQNEDRGHPPGQLLAKPVSETDLLNAIRGELDA